MTGTVRSAFIKWPHFNAQLRDTVSGLTDEQLAKQPSPERWPCGRPSDIWRASACSRFATQLASLARRRPRSPTQPTTVPATTIWSTSSGPSRELVAALDPTFRIVEERLDTWTIESLDEEIRHPEWDPNWVRTRGAILQRVFAHDVYHMSELNEWLGRAGLPEMALWDW